MQTLQNLKQEQKLRKQKNNGTHTSYYNFKAGNSPAFYMAVAQALKFMKRMCNAIVFFVNLCKIFPNGALALVYRGRVIYRILFFSGNQGSHQDKMDASLIPNHQLVAFGNHYLFTYEI